MKECTDPCRYEMAYAVQFQNLREEIHEVKVRVERLESILARGVTLLVVNLVGVVMMLVQQVVKL